MRRRVGSGSRSHEAFVDFRMILQTSLVVACVNCIFNMRWFRKVATVIIFDEIRADEGDLVSDELRRKSTVYPEKYNQAVVWISRGEEFYLQNSTYSGG